MANRRGCVHWVNPQLRNLKTNFTLGNYLFEPVKLTKNADLDKHKYGSYSIGLDSYSEFSLSDGSMGAWEKWHYFWS